MCRIYSLDQIGHKLIPLWADSATLVNVRVYASSGIVLISSRVLKGTENIKTFSMRQKAFISTIDPASDGSLLVFSRYYSVPNQPGQLELTYHTGPDVQSRSTVSKRLSVARSAMAGAATSEASQGELRLAGGCGPYGYGTADIIRMDSIQTHPWYELDFKQRFDGFPVPDSVIHMKESRGWSVIANEPDFRALGSTPFQNGLTEREVLIYDRKEKIWSSVIVPGNETRLCLINHFLAGVIEDSDPRMDWSKTNPIGLPSLQREESVIIDVAQRKPLVVHLGKDSEILWIAGYDVYYRVTDELYRAQMSGGDLTNRTLIAQDERIEDVHWAFIGGDLTGK